MGWKNTKPLGDVCLDENGNVHHTVSDDGYRTLYPYRANMTFNGREWKQDGWNNCAGYYKPAYLARLMRENKAMWA